MSDQTEGLAPLGGPAEHEVPQHTVRPGTPDETTGDVPLEEGQAYELAVEDGAPLPAQGSGDPGAGELAPEFRAPGED